MAYNFKGLCPVDESGMIMKMICITIVSDYHNNINRLKKIESQFVCSLCLLPDNVGIDDFVNYYVEIAMRDRNKCFQLYH